MRSFPLRATLLLCLMITLGSCTPPKEMIVKMLDGHLEKCKSAEGEFAEVKLFDGKLEEVLKSTCEAPIENLKIEDKIKASANIGPYTWHIGQNPDSGVWVLSGIEWREMSDARRILKEDDPDDNTLETGAKHFEAVEKQLPDSVWVKRSRLGLLLDLRKKTRKKKSKESEEQITGLGERAQAQYDAMLAWAKEKSEKDLGVEARVMVIEYYRDYDDFLDRAMETQGAGDEHLENSIKMAEKEKNEAEAEKYRKELAAVREARVKETEVLTARKALIKNKICKEAGELSADGVKDDALKTRAVSLKQSTKSYCASAPTEATPEATDK